MPAPALKRDAGRIGLLFASLGGMIGSGWLFGALNAAKIAGPASLIAWVIGGGAVLLLAFVFAELSTMFPQPGAVIVFPYLCFGRLAAQVMTWINFLAYISVPPVEAVSVINYSNNFFSGLVDPASGMLTMKGFAAAAALMVLFLWINLLAIRLVLKINSAITWWKLLVPAGTLVVLMFVHFRVRNFTQFGFAPTGMNGVLAAVSGSGVLFAYLGFRQAIELAGETSNPSRSLPFAIVGSVLLCILLYCGLELAFIGALTPASLANGWAKLSFPGISGPFAGLASGLGLTWLAITLYADAAISPGGHRGYLQHHGGAGDLCNRQLRVHAAAFHPDLGQRRAGDQPGAELFCRAAVFTAPAFLADARDLYLVHQRHRLRHRPGGFARLPPNPARDAI